MFIILSQSELYKHNGCGAINRLSLSFLIFHKLYIGKNDQLILELNIRTIEFM